MISLKVLVMMTRKCKAMEESPTETTMATLGLDHLMTMEREDAMGDAHGAMLLCHMGGARWMLATAIHLGEIILAQPMIGQWHTHIGIYARHALLAEDGQLAAQCVNGVVTMSVL